MRSADRWRRGNDDGMATVTALVLLFAFTSGGLIWLARDVDRTISNRSTAQSIAFQAARSAAQSVDVDTLRSGVEPRLDPQAAQAAARLAVSELLDGYGVVGRLVRVAINGADVEVTVEIDDPAGDVIGVGAARLEVGP